MATWALIVFLLGLCSLLFHIFNLFSWFTPWWAVLLMFSAFGMLTRIWKKEKEGEKELFVPKGFNRVQTRSLYGRVHSGNQTDRHGYDKTKNDPED